MNGSENAMSCHFYAARDYRAVYIRGRWRTVIRLIELEAEIGRRAECLVGKLIYQIKRTPLLLWMTLILVATVSQTANASLHELHRYRELESAAERPATLANAEWAAYRAAGLHCRSSIDGSNPSVVRQVKGRLSDPETFSHIMTTIWAQTSHNRDLIMTFRVGASVARSQVKEAHARINLETCKVRVLSIT